MPHPLQYFPNAEFHIYIGNDAVRVDYTDIQLSLLVLLGLVLSISIF